LPFDRQASGPLVICATLPGESHALGLQTAALVIAAAGLRIVYLGTDIPPAQLATLAADLSAGHVALSVSSAADGAAVSHHVRRLRQLLPGEVGVLIGGLGAPAPKPGVTVVADFDQLDAWARQVMATAGPLDARTHRR
jgi:methanogenic corrinoid protein MtbC1